MIKLDLGGKWEMRKLPEGEWNAAVVPGSVFCDLLDQGRIPDPFYRDNETIVREMARFDYLYARTFDATKELLSCKEVVLRCEGIDTLSEIRINGVLVAQTDNMHRTYEFAVKHLLKEGENRIEITLFSPLVYIEAKQKEKPIWGCVDAIPGFPYLRKGHYMFGWDWGPELPDLGIWHPISLCGFSDVRLDDVKVVQTHENGRVHLCVQPELSGNTEGALCAVSLTAPDGREVTQEVSCDAAEFTIENPRLWWPNGYGSQPLYTVTVVLLLDGEEQQRRTLRVGLRTIRVVREPDRWGESFYFEVNGTPIFAMGADYIPEDNLLSRRTPEKTRRLLSDCALANFNCVRVWGGGVYPEDVFYDACDELGLLVWQDFMFACATYDFTPQFKESITREAEDIIRRVRHHACLALWCGNNETESGFLLWSIPANEQMRRDYLEQNEVVLKEAVERFDGQTFYWPSSPSSGGGFDNPTDESRGDVHYWDVWHGMKPFTDYRNYYFRFVSEFGFQSFPCLKTVEEFTEPEDRNIFSYVMERHQKNGSANGRILSYLSENFQYPVRFSDLLYVSQILQAEAIQYGVLHWRAHRGRCMGAIYWQLNDCWPVASWSGIDSEGRWKALHYYAKRFFARRCVYAQVDGCRAGFYVLNETGASLRGTVRWSLCSRDGEILRAGRLATDTEAFSSSKVCEEDFSQELFEFSKRRQCYLSFALEDESGAVLSESTEVFVPEKHFEYANPQLKITVRQEDGGLAVTVAASSYARHVELTLKNGEAVFSDNYFDLPAGQEKSVHTLRLCLPEGEKADISVRSIYDVGTYV